MGKCAWIHHDSVRPLASIVDEVDQIALMVTLKRAQLMIGSSSIDKDLVDLGQCHVAIDMCLARSQEIEIWAMDDGYCLHKSFSSVVQNGFQ